jgi:hypothetical protein
MKTSNKLFTILLAVIFISIIATIIVPVIMSCTFSHEITGNGVHAKKTYELSNFNTIDMKTSGDIKIIIGNKNQVQLSGDSNILPYVTHQLKNKILLLQENKNFRTKLPLKITITAKTLNKFILSGAGNIQLSGINNKHFFIESNGFGNIEATGKTDNLKIETNGAGNINCKDLIAENVNVNTTGVGNIVLYAKSTLNATVTGIGNVAYYGNPKKINRNISGIGSLGAGK